MRKPLWTKSGKNSEIVCMANGQSKRKKEMVCDTIDSGRPAGACRFLNNRPTHSNYLYNNADHVSLFNLLREQVPKHHQIDSARAAGTIVPPRVTLQTTTRWQLSHHDRHPADDPEPRCRHQRESELGASPEHTFWDVH